MSFLAHLNPNNQENDTVNCYEYDPHFGQKKSKFA